MLKNCYRNYKLVLLLIPGLLKAKKAGLISKEILNIFELKLEFNKTNTIGSK